MARRDGHRGAGVGARRDGYRRLPDTKAKAIVTPGENSPMQSVLKAESPLQDCVQEKLAAYRTTVFKLQQLQRNKVKEKLEEAKLFLQQYSLQCEEFEKAYQRGEAAKCAELLSSCEHATRKKGCNGLVSKILSRCAVLKRCSRLEERLREAAPPEPTPRTSHYLHLVKILHHWQEKVDRLQAQVDDLQKHYELECTQLQAIFDTPTFVYDEKEENMKNQLARATLELSTVKDFRNDHLRARNILKDSMEQLTKVQANLKDAMIEPHVETAKDCITDQRAQRVANLVACSILDKDPRSNDWAENVIIGLSSVTNAVQEMKKVKSARRSIQYLADLIPQISKARKLVPTIPHINLDHEVGAHCRKLEYLLSVNKVTSDCVQQAIRDTLQLSQRLVSIVRSADSWVQSVLKESKKFLDANIKELETLCRRQSALLRVQRRYVLQNVQQNEGVCLLFDSKDSQYTLKNKICSSDRML